MSAIQILSIRLRIMGGNFINPGKSTLFVYFRIFMLLLNAHIWYKILINRGLD